MIEPARDSLHGDVAGGGAGGLCGDGGAAKGKEPDRAQQSR